MRVLIANRGEIALRIIRACHEEGLEAVAVYSDADRTLPYVRAADYAVRIGPPPARESYLDMDRVIAAARQSGAQAIHPGYGFLAERAVFAERVEREGLVFVGPPASAIRAMGDKTEARRRMLAAGVPVVPGGTEPIEDLDAAHSLAVRLGYPVLVKAAAGGGGRGMRVVERPGDLADALASAAAEAEKAFGDPSVYLEKCIVRPRHVEIQVLADHERTVHLGERECSIQRRHQKVVEESPSVAVSPALRARMGEAAVAAAGAVGYRSAGTCEFLLDADGSFYFLEMNTRIQVEHPVTELVYGVDLVREQLRIARGLPMSIPGGGQSLQPRGWAIECRITSEDPRHGLLPSTGRLLHLDAPGGPGVRWDAGYAAGDEVTRYYDSLLGKLIVHAPDRPAALERMRRAIEELVVVGVATNQGLLSRLLADPAFCRGEFDIQFLDRRPDLVAPDPAAVAHPALAVAAALLADERRRGAGRGEGAGPERETAATSVWLATARREALR
jgi:acetyl-CoA carboxylase biotin carboxylase subunit